MVTKRLIVCSYCGYCPQFKYEIGRTFGSTTHDLLSRPAIAKSGCTVLAEMTASDRLGRSVETRIPLVKMRTKSWGDQKLLEQMVPGYTGYRKTLFRAARDDVCARDFIRGCQSYSRGGRVWLWVV